MVFGTEVEYKPSPLQVATYFGFEEIVQRLLGTRDTEFYFDRKVYKSVTFHNVSEALFIAAHRGYKYFPCRFGTPLYNATERGYWAIVSFLVENGADVNTADLHGNSVLHKPIEKGNESIIRLLIENGADVNPSGTYDTPLDTAIRWRQNKSIIHLLVDRRAEITRGTIDAAVMSGQESIARFLAETMEYRRISTASSVSVQIPALEFFCLKNRLDFSDVEDFSEQGTPKPQKRMRR
ncbi:ankyrin repeat-containing domain protein [Pyronema domesticum]|nr:ankyrin repeat-containing domain protein [Pyronema domesticum]